MVPKYLVYHISLEQIQTAFFSSILAQEKLLDHESRGQNEESRNSVIYGNVGNQMAGAERSLVTVGRSLTVANGFPPARKAGGGLEVPLDCGAVF